MIKYANNKISHDVLHPRSWNLWAASKQYMYMILWLTLCSTTLLSKQICGTSLKILESATLTSLHIKQLFYQQFPFLTPVGGCYPYALVLQPQTPFKKQVIINTQFTVKLKKPSLLSKIPTCVCDLKDTSPYRSF